MQTWTRTLLRLKTTITRIHRDKYILKKIKYTPAVRSKISSKLIFASCVWYSDKYIYNIYIIYKYYIYIYTAARVLISKRPGGTASVLSSVMMCAGELRICGGSKHHTTWDDSPVSKFDEISSFFIAARPPSSLGMFPGQSVPTRARQKNTAYRTPQLLREREKKKRCCFRPVDVCRLSNCDHVVQWRTSILRNARRHFNSIAVSTK